MSGTCTRGGLLDIFYRDFSPQQGQFVPVVDLKENVT